MNVFNIWVKSTLDVSDASTVPLDVLRTQVAQVIKQKYPDVLEVHMTKCVASKGLKFRNALSISSCDTMIFAWPNIFTVPRFAYDAELKFDQENAAFKTHGTFLSPDPKLKISILSS
ncbi:hypothetical protein E1301_Tti023861 [Triplophysa tibetana]|uniref:Uncharacterized protein n=1 Tax=Triplophysa tibetana TaxID=1572043 RepID=A0A5A9MST8_9TELE|nr:hypothetical protein E1301_Tti023861 [Triplophysa tibetana]